jgi:hypothetical protein
MPPAGMPMQAPPPGYAYSYGAPGRTDGMCVTSLVLGCVGIMGALGIVSGVLAIIFGVIGIRNCEQNPGRQGRGMAVAGIALGAVFVALWGLLYATIFAMWR